MTGADDEESDWDFRSGPDSRTGGRRAEAHAQATKLARKLAELSGRTGDNFKFLRVYEV